MSELSGLTEPSSMTALASAASQYGPFFFAIVFVLFVPILGHRWFLAILLNRNLSAEERRLAINLHRLYWISGVAMGLALVLVAIMWWIIVQVVYIRPEQSTKFVDAQIGRRVFAVQINGVNQDDVISAPFNAPDTDYSVYADRHPFEPVNAVVIFRKPPEAGAQITLDYINAETVRSTMSNDSGVPWELTFSPSKCRRFMLVRNTPNPSLKPDC